MSPNTAPALSLFPSLSLSLSLAYTHFFARSLSRSLSRSLARGHHAAAPNGTRTWCTWCTFRAARHAANTSSNPAGGRGPGREVAGCSPSSPRPSTSPCASPAASPTLPPRNESPPLPPPPPPRSRPAGAARRSTGQVADRATVRCSPQRLHKTPCASPRCVGDEGKEGARGRMEGGWRGGRGDGELGRGRGGR